MVPPGPRAILGGLPNPILLKAVRKQTQPQQEPLHTTALGGVKRLGKSVDTSGGVQSMKQRLEGDMRPPYQRHREENACCPV
jgi:hypothetical protein